MLWRRAEPLTLPSPLGEAFPRGRGFTATTPEDKALHQRQIEATDRQIDALVYQLYGLTEEEIAIVEQATE